MLEYNPVQRPPSRSTSRNRIARARVEALLAAARTTSVIVFGDLIIDEFVWGSVTRVSPEAPVPVVWVERESAMPGGAANVASNLQALGGRPFLVGIVGDDPAGHRLRRLLAERGMETAGVVVDRSRPTTIKTRVVAHHQQVVRIDRERVAPLDAAVNRECAEAVLAQLPVAKAVIVEDYGKGVVTPASLKTVIGAAKRARRVITVDPKQEHIRYYRGVTALTPNRLEAAQAAGMPITDYPSLMKAGQRLMQRLHPESLLITLGEDGMCVFERGGRVTQIPTVAREVFDVSGAGDTVIAAFTLLRAAGASLVEAATIANAAAGVVVGKVGVAVCTPAELLKQLFGSSR